MRAVTIHRRFRLSACHMSNPVKRWKKRTPMRRYQAVPCTINHAASLMAYPAATAMGMAGKGAKWYMASDAVHFSISSMLPVTPTSTGREKKGAAAHCSQYAGASIAHPMIHAKRNTHVFFIPSGAYGYYQRGNTKPAAGSSALSGRTYGFPHTTG